MSLIPFAPFNESTKAAHRISPADAFAASLAKHRNCELVTADREFKVVENQLKKIRWLS